MTTTAPPAATAGGHAPGPEPADDRFQVEAFRAMGSRCRIVVDDGPPGTAAEARALADELEGRWSRFDPLSEISAINESLSAPTADHDQPAPTLHLVSAPTMRLLKTAVEAHGATEGLFHPRQLDQLAALGYDRTWADARRAPLAPLPNEHPATGPPTPSAHPANPALEPLAIELFPIIPAVRLSGSSRFDPGGIGKGLAADLVAEQLAAAGVGGASVELGGDVRVMGQAWFDDRWRIGVGHPFAPEAEAGAFTLSSGAVATSSRWGKRWRHGGIELHHLIDPRTGSPADTEVVAVSACGPSAAWAEVGAKAALIAGLDDAGAVLDRLGLAGLVVDIDGGVHPMGLQPMGERAGLPSS